MLEFLFGATAVIGGFVILLLMIARVDYLNNLSPKSKSFPHKTYFYNVETCKVEHVAEKWTSIPIGDPLLSHPYCPLTLELNESQVCYHITFLTSEQVVRKFEFNIGLQIDSQQDLEKLLEFLHEHGEIRSGKYDRHRIGENDVVWEYPVQKMLPVICGEYLAQLKKLDNPYDDKQQATFNDLIRAHLEPLLSGSSIEVESCHFYLS